MYIYFIQFTTRAHFNVGRYTKCTIPIACVNVNSIFFLNLCIFNIFFLSDNVNSHNPVPVIPH